MESVKVVTPAEMTRIEQTGDPERFMQEAGTGVATAVAAFIQERQLPKKVLMLVGVGNNGGDAWAAGAILLAQGFQVSAYPIAGARSVLNQKFFERFKQNQGRILAKLQFEDGVILDGLLGTGFRGHIEGEMASVITAANGSKLPILAIDIPSGLNGATGEGSVAIRSCETMALGLLKIGFFLRDGWNCVGTIRLIDFGLSKEAIASADAVAYVPKHLTVPKIVRNRHKYQAGYVVGFGGSKTLSGAIKLSGLAALRAGAGIVRLFHLEEIGPAPLELICAPWSDNEWKEALAKAGAVFVGPGLGRSKQARSWLKKHLGSIDKPCVVDADALMPEWTFPKGAVLTPHRGEALRLLQLDAAPLEEELFGQIIRFCERRDVVFVLKGAPTFIFKAQSLPMIIPRGDPGMAKAGTGDVLTGVIAALLSAGCTPFEAAVLGVALHALSGEFATKQTTSHCLIAEDLIALMPEAFRFVDAGHDIV